MRAFALNSLALGLVVISATGCESQAGLMMQYYFTPEGARARDAVKQLDHISPQASSHTTNGASVTPQAPGKSATEELAYVQDANVRQALSSSMGALSTDEKTASAQGQRLLELVIKSALAANENETATWNTAKLQKFFGPVAGINGVWADKPTMIFQKNGPLHYSVVTLSKNGNTKPIAMHFTTESDDTCRTADAVLRQQDKVAMEMVNKNGDRKNVPHPFGGKPCSKDDLQKNFKFFAVSLENKAARGSATPELAVIWKNDPKDNSVWVIHYRAAGVPESTDLLHSLESFL